MTTRKQREHQRDVDEGNVFTPKRLPPIPPTRVVPLKHKEKLEKQKRKEAGEDSGYRL
ncbi:MAG: hypothetical protein IIY92_01730 [Lachnospiraceae bacterium]|nr:hypothetical protein [Lachnospiraceae bacterium]